MTAHSKIKHVFNEKALLEVNKIIKTYDFDILKIVDQSNNENKKRIIITSKDSKQAISIYSGHSYVDGEYLYYIKYNDSKISLTTSVVP